MRIALISDIHGNCVALEEVLKDIREVGVEQIVCLGDVASLGPEPRKAIEVLQTLGCPVVMGNTDQALYDPPEIPAADDRLLKIKALHEWAAAQLDREHLEYVGSFKPVLHVNVPSGFLCCHGSPKSFEDKILATTPDDVLADYFEGVEAALVAGGHTHLPLLRTWRDLTFVNPGSVGMPFRAHPDGNRLQSLAEYAIVEDTGVSFRRVPFDPATVHAKAEEARMPHLGWWLEWWKF